MTVSIESVKSDIQIFQSMSDEHVQSAIDDATVQAKQDQINEDGFDMGVKQYAKHLLYIDSFMSSGGVTAASTFGNSQTIADKTDSSPYLNQYRNTVLLFGKGSKGAVIFYE